MKKSKRPSSYRRPLTFKGAISVTRFIFPFQRDGRSYSLSERISRWYGQAWKVRCGLVRAQWPWVLGSFWQVHEIPSAFFGVPLRAVGCSAPAWLVLFWPAKPVQSWQVLPGVPFLQGWNCFPGE